MLVLEDGFMLLRGANEGRFKDGNWTGKGREKEEEPKRAAAKTAEN